MKTVLVEGFDIKTCYCYGEGYTIGLPEDTSNTMFVVTTQMMQDQLSAIGLPCVSLDSIFGVGNFYELYCKYFGDAVTDIEAMLKTVYTGLFNKTVQSVYVIKLGVFFTWFNFTPSGSLDIKGSYQFSKTYSLLSIGYVIKHLNKLIAESGCSINNSLWLVWDSGDLPQDFRRYLINIVYLKPLVYQVFNESFGYREFYAILSKAYTKQNITAENFIRLLVNTRDITGFNIQDGIVSFSNKKNIVDYSTIERVDRGLHPVNGGIIIDTEGIKGRDVTAGFRECGGIIFQEYRDCLLRRQDFMCDKALATETFLSAFDILREYLPNKRIPIKIYTYGGVDETMLRASIDNSILNKVIFIDATFPIKQYLEAKGITPSSYKLRHVAEAIGVLCVTPVHEAISDAKTLFNILSQLKRENYNIE